ncbi:programmed cell death protein 2-like [Gambusia affinis]|uniref:programmed cell death protein 2-like n=1 Tax=Gambusia affinis TaxID=33528 RepID=UPI001CDC8908|nr:programmed cell death protein 2-like [Gambusia affinis]XP_043979975.1 programmed cell death protein 2-like [Gambusia affinis]
MADQTLLIGLNDGELDPRKYRSTFLTNKVGGKPDWSSAVTGQSPCCRLCSAPLAHVVQVYCPLQDSPYHRNLHLFACCQPGCSGMSGSWTVLRSQCAEAPNQSSTPQVVVPSATDWCEFADDWGMEREEDDSGCRGGDDHQQQSEDLQTGVSPTVCPMDVSSGLQQLSLVEFEDVPVFRPFFISVVEESELCEEDDQLAHAQELLREYERREGAAVWEAEEGGDGGGGEKYEKAGARHGDAVFSRFMKAVSLCPRQILRYCRHSKPLFISKPPSKGSQEVPACGSCGEPRTFELQLMPALVSLLQRTDSSPEDELEFGTVLVYTCTNSCWTAGANCPVEEFCFVQPDPDQQLFK